MSKSKYLCECCEKKSAAVLLKIGRKEDDWLHLSCDKCFSFVCQDCCDVDEKTGYVICVDCMQQESIRKILG